MRPRRRGIVRREAVFKLAITRKGAFATTAQNLFVWITDTSALGTGWLPASQWNP